MDDLLLLFLFVIIPAAGAVGAIWCALWLMRRYGIGPELSPILAGAVASLRRNVRVPSGRLTLPKPMQRASAARSAATPHRAAPAPLPAWASAPRPAARPPALAQPQSHAQAQAQAQAGPRSAHPHDQAAPPQPAMTPAERLAAIRELLAQQWAGADGAADPFAYDRPARIAMRLANLGASPEAIAGALMESEREAHGGMRADAENRAMAVARVIVRLPTG